MNPAEFLLDLATGEMNDISVPQELLAFQGTAEYEKVVVKVSNSYSGFLPSTCFEFHAMLLISICCCVNSIYKKNIK